MDKKRYQDHVIRREEYPVPTLYKNPAPTKQPLLSQVRIDLVSSLFETWTMSPIFCFFDRWPVNKWYIIYHTLSSLSKACQHNTKGSLYWFEDRARKHCPPLCGQGKFTGNGDCAFKTRCFPDTQRQFWETAKRHDVWWKDCWIIDVNKLITRYFFKVARF